MYGYSCGSIPGRGGIYGKRYLEKYIRENPSKSKYCLKCDIRHFYQSIDINMLKDKLSQKIHDAKMLHVLFLVLDSNIVIHKGKDINIGLPIGYYTSQWFANWYLQELDHYIKEDLKINCYVRYVDDLVMLSNNKKHLHKSLKSLKEYFKNLELEIKGNYQVFRLVYTDKHNKVRGRPIDFMGFKFFKDKTIIRKSIFMKAMKTIRKVSKKEYITVHEAYQIISILGWFKHTNSYMVYQEKVKPYVNIGKCKRIISNHTKGKDVKMLLNWKNVESLERPIEVDAISTKNGIYFRKNIVETDGKFKYQEVLLSNDYRFNILDTEEYLAKLLEVFKAETQKENEQALAAKKTIVTSIGEFSIKTPTYDFIFCLMALKGLPTGIPEGRIRFYGGEFVPAMTQAQVQALYLEYANAVATLDSKFVDFKNKIESAVSIQSLEEIQISY